MNDQKAKVKGLNKTVFTKYDLIAMGYPRRMIDELRHSDDFAEMGFRYGRTDYFYLDKFKKYI